MPLDNPEAYDDIDMMEQELGDAMQLEDEMMTDMGPSGTFSPEIVSQLATALSGIVERFFGEPTDLTFTTDGEQLTQFPPEIARAFSMVVSMLSDAVEANAIDAKYAVDVESVSDDLSLRSVISRLRALMSDRTAQKELEEFLEQPVSDEIVDEPVEETGFVDDEIDDDFLMERI